MKNNFIVHNVNLKLTGFGMLLLVFLSYMPGAVQAQALNYAIDSTSLQILDFEGGHCQFRITDINDDGFNDILGVGDHGSPLINTSQHGITVFFGNGTGTGWTLYQEGDFGYGGIAVGDVNNDGFKDVGYGIHHNYSGTDLGNQVLEVALGNGTGAGWVPYDDSLGLQGQTWGMFGTDFGDINNDGLLDIGSNSFGCCDGVHVNMNNGNGSWSYAYGFLGGNSSQVFRFADFNNDGYMDFAAARQGGITYFGDGTGSFVNKSTGLPSTGVLDMDYMDVANTDGDPANELGFCFNGGVFVYKWNEALQQWQNVSGTLPASGGYYTMSFADLNNDGFTDVAAAGNASLIAYTGNGTNTWTSAATVPIPAMSFPQDMTIGDIDHNGRPEVLLLAQFPAGLFNYVNKVFIFREITIPSSNSIAAVTPVLNQCYPNSAVRNITWNTSLVPGTTAKVTIELSSTGAAGVFDTIAVAIPNNGSYQWLVSDTVQSAYCFFRFTLTDTTGTIVLATALSAQFNIGCQTTTSIASHETEMESLMCFPNPANNGITVRCGEANNTDRIFNITDIAGRVLFSEILKHDEKQISFSVRHLNPGVYFVTDAAGGLRGKFVRE